MALTVNGTALQTQQIRGPVGYTVVGSPTIVDGVVSNLDRDNYLQLTQKISIEEGQDFEMIFKIHTPDTIEVGGAANCFFSFGYDGIGYDSGIYLGKNASGYNYFRIAFYGLISGSSPSNVDSWQPNTDYYIRIARTNGQDVVAQSSTDKQTWTTFRTQTSNIAYKPTLYFPVFGHNLVSYATQAWFTGSIDLNETYIKVNGKLLFWQPQPTKYIIKDGKLVWADPNIYLQSTGTQKIDTGLIRNGTNDNYRFVTSISYQDNQARQLNGSVGFMYFGALSGHYQITNSAGNYENVLCPLDEFVNVDVFFDCPNQACSYTVGSASRSFTLPTGDPYSSQNVEIFLFNITNNNFPCKCKMKPFKIYKNGILVRDFAPVPTGLVIGNYTVPSNGMFDIVNQQFYPNAGTGTFTIGRDA